jgi:uncharacterized short protein YbdD (DUF466 family)
MSRSSRLRADAPDSAAKDRQGSRSLARLAVRWAEQGWCLAVRAARLAVGIPDYEAYVAHVRDRHPGRAPMDRAAFMLDRMQARYGRGRARCC